MSHVVLIPFPVIGRLAASADRELQNRLVLGHMAGHIEIFMDREAIVGLHEQGSSDFHVEPTFVIYGLLHHNILLL